LALPACKSRPKERQTGGGDATLGKQAMTKYGCGSCHIIPGIEGAVGRVGNPLLGFGDRSDIAGVAGNTPDNLIKWIQRPQDLNPASKMPYLGVTEKDARDIAAYLYTLRTN